MVEAATRSGSLITARFAAEQGREVYAVPGSIYSPLSRGCHRLIRDGAKLVEGVDDIVEEIAHRLESVGLEGAAAAPKRLAEVDTPPRVSSAQQAVLERLGYEGNSVDSVVEGTGLTPETVCSMLLELELAGLVASIPGGRYARVPRR